MNKYTKKIIDFINKNNFKIDFKKDKISLKKNLFISKILDICKEINMIELPKFDINIKNIDKLHSINEYPQLYYFFKKYNPNITSFKDFISYYSLNQHQINIHDLQENIRNDPELSEMYNIIYNSNNDRSELVNIFYNNFQSIDIIQEIETHDLKHIELRINKPASTVGYGTGPTNYSFNITNSSAWSFSGSNGYALFSGSNNSSCVLTSNSTGYGWTFSNNTSVNIY